MIGVLESYFGYVVMACVDVFRFGCMNILGLVLKFGRMLMASILDFSIGYPNTICNTFQVLFGSLAYGD